MGFTDTQSQNAHLQLFDKSFGSPKRLHVGDTGLGVAAIPKRAFSIVRNRSMAAITLPWLANLCDDLRRAIRVVSHALATRQSGACRDHETN